MMASGPEIIILLLLLSGGSDVPQDLLSVVAPDVGLAILEEKTDTSNLERLIRGAGDGAADAPAGEVSDTVKNAIQNLASSSEKLRERAREELIDEGPAILGRLREVAEKDQRRAEEAKKVIAAIEAKEKEAGHAKELARLFAMRFAAANKITSLVPALREAAESDDPFVRLAAEDALFTLDKTYERAAEPPAPRVDTAELAALPSDTKLLQVVKLPPPEPGKPGVTMQSLAKEMREAMAGFAPPDADFEADVHEGAVHVVEFAKAYGNMRPLSACIANVGGIDEQGGGLGIIVRGFYERAVLEATLGQSPLWSSSEIAGHKVYNSPFLRLVPLSDRSVLVLPITASARFPLEDYLKSLAAKEEPLRKNERLSRFLDAVNDATIARGIAVTDETLMSALYEELQGELAQEVLDALKAMQEIELTVASAADGKSLVRFEAEFQKGEAAEKLSGFVREQVDQGIAMMEAQKANVPIPFFAKMMETGLGILRSIKVSTEGKRGIARLEVPQMKILEFLGSVSAVRDQ